AVVDVGDDGDVADVFHADAKKERGLWWWQWTVSMAVHKFKGGSRRPGAIFTGEIAIGTSRST
ncbi:MAG: hypothetical protein ACKOEG_10275, partial [Chthoniobacterales bacterium]